MVSKNRNQEQVVNQRRRTCRKNGCPLVVNGRTYCPAHEREHSENMKTRSRRRKAEPKCISCGSEVPEPENGSFSYCAKCRLRDGQLHIIKQADHMPEEQSTQPEAAPREQRKTGAVADPEKRPCHWSGCAVIVGSSRSMCPAHSVEHAQYQAARRKTRREELKCGRCRSKLDDPRFSCCATCRYKKTQYSRNRRAKGNTQGQSTQAEPATRERMRFIDLVCNPESNDDIEVAEILLKMSKSLLLDVQASGSGIVSMQSIA